MASRRAIDGARRPSARPATSATSACCKPSMSDWANVSALNFRSLWALFGLTAGGQVAAPAISQALLPWHVFQKAPAPSRRGPVTVCRSGVRPGAGEGADPAPPTRNTLWGRKSKKGRPMGSPSTKEKGRLRGLSLKPYQAAFTSKAGSFLSSSSSLADFSAIPMYRTLPAIRAFCTPSSPNSRPNVGSARGSFCCSSHHAQ